MTQEKLANELGISQSYLRVWLQENNYKTNPMEDKGIKAARKHFKIRSIPKEKTLMNKMCKGCLKDYKSDVLCASNGTQRRCPVYKWNRNKRKKIMGIAHKKRGVMNVSSER